MPRFLTLIAVLEPTREPVGRGWEEEVSQPGKISRGSEVVSFGSGGRVDAFEELEARGVLGEAGYSLFVGRAAREVRRGNYPAPVVGTDWSANDVAEVIHELFMCRGPSLTAKLLEATSLDSLERLVTTIVKNFLVDLAKASAAGKLRSRMNTLMDADDRFDALKDYRWTLTGGSTLPTSADSHALEASAWCVTRVYLPTELNTSGSTSVANANALLRVALHVLNFAAGSVRAAELTRAVGRRFGLLAPSTTQYVDHAQHGSVSTMATDPVGTQAASAQLAAQLVADLDPDEQVAARHFGHGGSVTALAKALGCGRRQATAVADRFTEKMQLALQGEDALEETMKELLSLLAPAQVLDAPNGSSAQGDRLMLETVTSPIGGRDE